MRHIMNEVSCRVRKPPLWSKKEWSLVLTVCCLKILRSVLESTNNQKILRWGPIKSQQLGPTSEYILPKQSGGHRCMSSADKCSKVYLTFQIFFQLAIFLANFPKKTSNASVQITQKWWSDIVLSLAFLKQYQQDSYLWTMNLTFWRMKCRKGRMWGRWGSRKKEERRIQ